jgi:hypothetical protein
MNRWKYLLKDSTIVTCKSDTRNIGNAEYYGCCKNCIFAKGKYGDHWTTDRIWCDCPVPIKKGETLEILHIKKYRKIVNNV